MLDVLQLILGNTLVVLLLTVVVIYYDCGHLYPEIAVLSSNNIITGQELIIRSKRIQGNGSCINYGLKSDKAFSELGGLICAKSTWTNKYKKSHALDAIVEKLEIVYKIFPNENLGKSYFKNNWEFYMNGSGVDRTQLLDLSSLSSATTLNGLNDARLFTSIDNSLIKHLLCTLRVGRIFVFISIGGTIRPSFEKELGNMNLVTSKVVNLLKAADNNPFAPSVRSVLLQLNTWLLNSWLENFFYYAKDNLLQWALVDHFATGSLLNRFSDSSKSHTSSTGVGDSTTKPKKEYAKAKMDAAKKDDLNLDYKGIPLSEGLQMESLGINLYMGMLISLFSLVFLRLVALSLCSTSNPTATPEILPKKEQ